MLRCPMQSPFEFCEQLRLVFAAESSVHSVLVNEEALRSELAGKLICSNSHLVSTGINHEEAFEESMQPSDAIRKVIAKGAYGH